MKRLLLALAFPVLAHSADIRSIPSTLLFSAGTTTRDASGRDWAYLLWQAPAADLIANKVIAIYAKTGDASSGALFHREAIVQSSVDASVLGGIITRAETLGMDLNALDGALTGIAQAAELNVPSLPADRAARTAMVLRKAYTDPSLSASLRGVCVAQPSLALCLGLAWTGPMPTGATMTYELREFDSVTNSDLAVIGRVTLTGGAPVALPAAGNPVQLPDTTANGDLSIKVRWATPDALRRRVFLHQGFNVYRVAWSLVQAQGWGATPITPAQLQARIASGHAIKVNDSPLYTQTVLSDAEALDVMNNKAVHLNDDNHRNANPAAPTPFADGAEFGYIVTPRDLLGRDGVPSLAGYAQARRTLPPAVPTGLKVEVVRGVNPPTQFFRITWKQNADDAAVPTTCYEIFRSDGQVLDANGQPAGALVGQPLHQPGSSTRTIDDTNGVLVQERSYGITVRAVYAGAGGDIVSALSAPVYAALANETPPPAPYATATPQCLMPAVVFVDETTDTTPVANDGLNHFRMSCRRRDPNVDWAEFSVTIAVATVAEHTIELGRFDFGEDDVASFDFTLPTSYLDGSNVTPPPASNASGPPPPAIPFSFLRFSCRVGNPFTVISNPADYGQNYRNDTLPLTGTHVLNYLSGSLSLANLKVGEALSETFLNRVNATILSSFTVVDPATNLISGIAYTPTLSYRGNYVARVINGDLVGLGPALTSGFVSLTFIDPTPGGPAADASDYVVFPLSIPDCITNVGAAPVDGTGRTVPVSICVNSPPEAVEYRVYRRIDEGAPALVTSGKVTPGNMQSCVYDFGIPAAGGRVSHYAQVVGRNGVTSPMFFAGTQTVTPKPPLPVLAPPRATGNVLLPTMKLSWTCPTEGAERFEFFITTSTGGTYSSLNAQFSQWFVPTPASYNTNKKYKSATSLTTFSERLSEGLLTPRIGSVALGDGPQFEMELPVQPNVKYKVSMRARNRAVTGPTTTMYEFTWKSPPPPQVEHQIPWPFRHLPALGGLGTMKNLPSLPLTDLVWPDPNEGEQAGFKIGTIPRDSLSEFFGDIDNDGRYAFFVQPIATRLRFGFDSYVDQRYGFRGPTRLPAVLYRRQTPNEAWPNVSGEIIQVTPLVSNIAMKIEDDGNTWVLKDPFIAASIDKATVVGMPDGELPVSAVGLYLLDTTPRLAGAAYTYFLVCFSETTGEPECVFPANLEVRE